VYQAVGPASTEHNTHHRRPGGSSSSTVEEGKRNHGCYTVRSVREPVNTMYAHSMRLMNVFC
jgi:hypothetical protein